MVFQGVEWAVPVTRQGGQELLSHLHRRRLQPVAHPASLTRFGRNQTSLSHQGQVFGNRLPSDRKRACEVGRSRRTARRQRRQNGASGRVSQRDEDLFGDCLDVRRRQRGNR